VLLEIYITKDYIIFIWSLSTDAFYSGYTCTENTDHYRDILNQDVLVWWPSGKLVQGHRERNI